MTNLEIDSEHNKYSCQKLENQSLQFPIQVKKMTDEETKEYHLKKLYEMSLGSIGQIPRLEDPNEEQSQWIENRMKAPEWTWQRWYVGLYFTEEQKKDLGLTDKDISGKGMG